MIHHVDEITVMQELGQIAAKVDAESRIDRPCQPDKSQQVGECSVNAFLSRDLSSLSACMNSDCAKVCVCVNRESVSRK